MSACRSTTAVACEPCPWSSSPAQLTRRGVVRRVLNVGRWRELVMEKTTTGLTTDQRQWGLPYHTRHHTQGGDVSCQRCPLKSDIDPVHGAVNRVSVGVNNFGEVMSNSRNTVSRPIQPIRSLNIGIRGPPGRSLEPRHILFSHRRTGWEKG